MRAICLRCRIRPPRGSSMATPPEIRAAIEAEIEQSPLQLAAVIDYLLVTTYDHGGRTPAGFAGPVGLAGDVRIERLDDELSERLLRASELRGENWDPTR